MESEQKPIRHFLTLLDLSPEDAGSAMLLYCFLPLGN